MRKVIPISGVSSLVAATSTTPAVPATQWLSGSGAPSSELGVNGDFYLNTQNGGAYKKADGAWAYTMNLTGPAGPVAPEHRLGTGWACDTFTAYDTDSVYLNQGIGWGARGVGSGVSLVSREAGNNQAETLLSIGEGQFSRKFSWGNRWNRLRICVLARVNGSASFDADFALGVCSGTSYPFASTKTDNFCGVWTPPGLGNTWTFSEGAAFDSFSSEYLSFVSRRGSVSTERGGAGSAALSFAATGGYAIPFMVEIFRPAFSGSDTVNYSFFAGGLDGVSQNWDWTYASTLEWVRGAGPLSITAPYAGINAAYNFDESEGTLDTLNLYWSNVDRPLEIRSLIVWRMH